MPASDKSTEQLLVTVFICVIGALLLLVGLGIYFENELTNLFFIPRVIAEIGCLAERHDYALLLKVPCAGFGVWLEQVDMLSQRAAYMPISHAYRADIDAAWGVRPGRSCATGGQHCGIQDLLFVDIRMPELRHLIALGNAECMHPALDLAASARRWQHCAHSPTRALSLPAQAVPASLSTLCRAGRPRPRVRARRPPTRRDRRPR